MSTLLAFYLLYLTIIHIQSAVPTLQPYKLVGKFHEQG